MTAPYPALMTQGELGTENMKIIFWQQSQLGGDANEDKQAKREGSKEPYMKQ